MGEIFRTLLNTLSGMGNLKEANYYGTDFSTIRIMLSEDKVLCLSISIEKKKEDEENA